MIHGRRLLAVALAAATLWMYASFPVPASDAALLRGKVVDADGTTPRHGVIVTLVGAERGSSFDSVPTDEHGVFRIDSAAPGSYQVVARAPEGAFLAPGRLQLGAGENPPIALTLLADEPDQGEQEPPEGGETPAEPKPEEPKPEQPTTPTLPPPPPEEGLPHWAKWVIIGSLGVVAAGVVDAASQEERTASGF